MLVFPLFSPKPQPTRLTGSQCRLMKVRGYAVSKQLVQFIWKEIHAHEVCDPVNTAGWVCLLFFYRIDVIKSALDELVKNSYADVMEYIQPVYYLI